MRQALSLGLFLGLCLAVAWLGGTSRRPVILLEIPFEDARVGVSARQQQLFDSICLAETGPLPAACAWHPKAKRRDMQDFEDMYAASLDSGVSQWMPEDIPYSFYDSELWGNPGLARVSDAASQGTEAYMEDPSPLDISPELEEAAAAGAPSMETALDTSAATEYDAVKDPYYRWILANKDLGNLWDMLDGQDQMRGEEEPVVEPEEPAPAQEVPSAPAEVVQQEDSGPPPIAYKMGRPSASQDTFPFKQYPVRPHPAQKGANFGPFQSYTSSSIGTRRRWNYAGSPIDEPNVMGR